MTLKMTAPKISQILFKILSFCTYLAHHSHVDVASVELHVDLLVNHSLRVGVKVNPDTGSHFFYF